MILDIGNRPVLDLSADKEGEIDKTKTGETIFLYYIIIIFYNQLTPQILGSLSNLYQTRNFIKNKIFEELKLLMRSALV